MFHLVSFFFGISVSNEAVLNGLKKDLGADEVPFVSNMKWDCWGITFKSRGF